MRHKASPDPATRLELESGTNGRPTTYRRMSKAEKLRYDGMESRVYSLFRCRRCQVAVVARDRAQHLERCWPEVLMRRFAKVS